MVPKLSLDYVLKLLKDMVPEYEEMLLYIEKSGGHFQLTPEINDAIVRLKVDNYPELYLDEIKIWKLVALSALPADEINRLGREVEKMPVEERSHAFESFVSLLIESSNHIFESFPYTPEDQEEARINFEQMSPDEKNQAILQAQITLSGYIPSLFNIFSMMVHGRKLTDLVQAAVNGDDEAFLLAVQIDKRILSLPYFAERRRRAESDPQANLHFLKSLNYRLTNPLLRGKIRFKTLWLSFAVLDLSGHLDGSLSYANLLDILDQVGLAGYGNRISDESSLGKRIREYRQFQNINKSSRH